MKKTGKSTKKILPKSVDNNKYQNWSGDMVYFILFSDYLDQNYKNVYISKYKLLQVVDEPSLKFDYLNQISLFDSIKIYDIIKEFENTDKEFIIYSIIIIFPLGGGHQNSLIINKKTLEAELFEPYGDIDEIIKDNFAKDKIYKEIYDNTQQYFNSRIYHNNIENFIDKLNKKIKLFKPVDFLPQKGFQSIEENFCNQNNYKINTDTGFCVAWTMYFIEYRIKYPNKPRNYIVNKIMKKVKEGKTDKYVCKLIRDYTSFLLKLYNDKSFFDKVRLNWSAKKYNYLVRSAIIGAFIMLGASSFK